MLWIVYNFGSITRCELQTHMSVQKATFLVQFSMHICSYRPKVWAHQTITNFYKSVIFPPLWPSLLPKVACRAASNRDFCESRLDSWVPSDAYIIYYIPPGYSQKDRKSRRSGAKGESSAQVRIDFESTYHVGWSSAEKKGKTSSNLIQFSIFEAHWTYEYCGTVTLRAWVFIIAASKLHIRRHSQSSLIRGRGLR